jgi:hypothetical protein
VRLLPTSPGGTAQRGQPHTRFPHRGGRHQGNLVGAEAWRADLVADLSEHECLWQGRQCLPGKPPGAGLGFPPGRQLVMVAQGGEPAGPWYAFDGRRPPHAVRIAACCNRAAYSVVERWRRVVRLESMGSPPGQKGVMPIHRGDAQRIPTSPKPHELNHEYYLTSCHSMMSLTAAQEACSIASRYNQAEGEKCSLIASCINPPLSCLACRRSADRL